MPHALGRDRMVELLAPYVGGRPLTADQLSMLSTYMDLLIRWNARTNLTAVREPEALLQRQIGESLFAARFVPSSGTLLDFGSGGGFPGLPLAIYMPTLVVTLAESQGKKAGFLREVVRTLDMPVQVWGGRVEAMPPGEVFAAVAMRAVDRSGEMMPAACARVARGGILLRYTGSAADTLLQGWEVAASEQVPHSLGSVQVLLRC